MGLRIIAGPPGSGKTRAIIDEILELNAQDPLGPPLILLVPEQATLQAERLLLSGQAKGYVRIEVLSFARLGRWIEARRPRAKRPVLTDVHREVIVTGVLARMKREGADEGLASVSHLESSVAALLGEMRHGNIRTSELEDWAGRVESDRPALARKLHRIAKVAAAFDKAVGERFEDPQDTMLSLAASVREMTDLQGARVYVDSFFGFTAVEREVLRGLLARVPHVTVTLVMDRPIESVGTTADFKMAPTGRCAPSIETLKHLLRLAEREALPAPELVNLTMGEVDTCRYQTWETRAVAEKFLTQQPVETTETPISNLRMIEAADIRDQARAAALQIEQWHRERQWHWGEMAIIARDVDSVAQEIGEALNALRIPHFMDRHQPEATHPVVQGSLTALDTVLRGWHQESLLAFAKSGLYGFDERAVARLEWFALQYPRRASEWKSADAWEAPPERSPFEPGEGRRREPGNITELDAIRRQVAEPLLALEKRLDEARGNDGELPANRVVEALCHLIHGGMQPQIEACIANEEPERAREDEQVLVQVGRLLDAVAMAAQDDAFEDMALLDLLGSVLGQFRLQRIPPLIDQLIVAQADRSRLHEVKGVVVVGLAEGEFPAPGSNRSLLSDEDREHLAQFTESSLIEKEIKASARELFRREAFYAWMAMARASEAMTLLRSKTSRTGEALKESPWWIEIDRLFRRQLTAQTTDATAPEDRVARARETATIIGGRWGELRDMSPPLEAERLTRYAADFVSERDRREFCRVIEWAAQRNEADLTTILALEYFGDNWSASATALEAFASCPFKFFMGSMMRPDIRQDTQVNNMDLGNLAHAVLKAVFDTLRHDQKDLGTLSDEEVTRLVGDCMAAPIGRLQKAGLFGSNMGGIQADLIRGQIEEVVLHFRRLAQLTTLRNLHTEVGFPTKDDTLTAPVITVAVGSGKAREVPLRGQIDRIDSWGDGWLFVIDYKLSSRVINWTEVADGKSVQLPIYLLVLEEIRSKLTDSDGRIGGAFYEAISSKEVDYKRLRGVISSSAAVDLGLLDSKPKMITGGFTRDGTAQKNGDMVDDADFSVIMPAARILIARQLQGILGGVITVHPARVDKQTPCSFCDHRMACRLDYAMNKPRLVPKLNKLGALDKLANIAGEVAQ